MLNQDRVSNTNDPPFLDELEDDTLQGTASRPKTWRHPTSLERSSATGCSEAGLCESPKCVQGSGPKSRSNADRNNFIFQLAFAWLSSIRQAIASSLPLRSDSPRYTRLAGARIYFPELCRTTGVS